MSAKRRKSPLLNPRLFKAVLSLVAAGAAAAKAIQEIKLVLKEAKS